MGFITVNCYFIRENKLRNTVLKTMALEESHSAEHIKNWLKVAPKLLYKIDILSQ